MRLRVTRKVEILLFAGLLFCLVIGATSSAQTPPAATSAPGSSLPGLGGLMLGMDGPGYIEAGGSHSSLSGDNSDWNDFYMRGMISGGRNAFTGQITREGRFGESGWFGGLDWVRTLSENWYAEVSAGGSVGGFFLPRFRTDGLINRKLLRRRQLVATLGVGFDQSKTVNYDVRGLVGAAYYFSYPVVLQGGLNWTHASPGNILARTQFIAATQGHDKERFISLRYEWGREGYEVIGPPAAQTPAYNVLFDFPERTATGTWRQWIGPNWGLNFNVEQHQETAYHRWGGTAGVFIDF